MDSKQKARAEADKRCDSMVKKRLQEGGWVSSAEWIALREREEKKALSDREILNCWL